MNRVRFIDVLCNFQSNIENLITMIKLPDALLCQILCADELTGLVRCKIKILKSRNCHFIDEVKAGKVLLSF